jgi:signal recognition particle receptor subunit beta
MSFVHHQNKEINCKIIYCGAGLSGKTTNIQYIYDHTTHPGRGSLIKVGSENDRTLFFDFLPLATDEVKGYRTRFHLYSIPGQTFYDVSRHFILKGVDGIVFVIDSRSEQMEENIDAFASLEKGLQLQGYDIQKVPLIFQYNKRDLPDSVSIQELQATFNAARRPYQEAVASRGEGVMETLQEISQLVLRDLNKGGSL